MPRNASFVKSASPWAVCVATGIVNVGPGVNGLMTALGVGVVVRTKFAFWVEPLPAVDRFRLTVFTIGRAGAGGPKTTPASLVPVEPVKPLPP